MKAETEIITNIAASPIRRTVILMTMYVTLTNNYQYEYHISSLTPENITQCDESKNIQITDRNP